MSPFIVIIIIIITTTITIIAIIIVINMLLLLILLVYITRSSGRVQELWQNSDYQTLITYKAQWKNLRAFSEAPGYDYWVLVIFISIYFFFNHFQC